MPYRPKSPTFSVPPNPKIYHIVHVDRLESILECEGLYSDAEVRDRALPGSAIGMGHIKERRLKFNKLDSHFDLTVGQCVPFNFCPRSVMLYKIYRKPGDLAYHGGQESIVHLEADLYGVVDALDRRGLRWAFTLVNAACAFFEDRCSLASLEEINWPAVHELNWAGVKDSKQAEFLVERFFPWSLVDRVGVLNPEIHRRVRNILRQCEHQPTVEVIPGWYY